MQSDKKENSGQTRKKIQESLIYTEVVVAECHRTSMNLHINQKKYYPEK